jgi:CheY-like chemotaxis protein
VWNLLTNAIKFTPRGGQVIVRLEQVEQDAQLTVADNGKGINASFLPFVFDRFSQEDNSLTRQFGGLGLGLALARQLAEAHGGTITAFSAGADQGATFTVRLPLLPAAAEKALAPPEAQPKRSLHGTTILLVEDEPDSQDLIVEILTDVGANIVAVGSADEALEALPQGSFDVLVSDIGLPFTNGYRLMQQVRQIVSAEALPAVAFTAYAGSQNRKIALEVGYQEHLSKPVDPQTLVSTIANLLKLPIA